MKNREEWRRFLEILDADDEISGAVVLETNRGEIIGRCGRSSVFVIDDETGRDQPSDVAPNVEDVWMEEIAGRYVLVAFERDADVTPIQDRVERAREQAGL